MTEPLKSKKVLVTGITGQVGRSLQRQLAGRCQLFTSARSGGDIDMDLSDQASIVRVMKSIKPDIVFNPAAYTQVDQAEDEPEIAKQINGVAPGILANLCKEQNALLVHYSTDYVFNGQASEPYREDDPVDPINVYGATKLAGEQAIQASGCDHLIFRTCWVYDAEGRNFLNAIIDRAKRIGELKVVNDQQGTPTSADFIAETSISCVSKMINNEIHLPAGQSRIYNLRPDGFCSWYDFAKVIVDYLAESEGVYIKSFDAVSSDQFVTKAKRPAWSVLDTAKLQRDFHVAPLGWDHYVRGCLYVKAL